MRHVPVAAVRPHRCACIPFIGSHDAGGFFDFGTEIAAFDGHVYVSVVAARQMAEAMGWAPASQASGLVSANERLQDQVRELEAEIAGRDEQLAAVHTLKLAGATASRKPGRPAKAVA